MKKATVYFLIAIAFAIALASCSTTKKYKSKQTEKAATEYSIQIAEMIVKKSDSSNLKQKDSSYDDASSIAISFDNSFILVEDSAGSNMPMISFPEMENDYEGAPVKIKPAVTKVAKATTIIFSYMVGDQKITSPVPIKNINLVDNKTGKTTAIEITQQKKEDSTVKSTGEKSKTTTEKTVEVKDKKTVSYFWLYVVIACIVAAWIIYQIPAVQAFLRPIFLLFKRRKKEVIT